MRLRQGLVETNMNLYNTNCENYHEYLKSIQTTREQTEQKLTNMFVNQFFLARMPVHVHKTMVLWTGVRNLAFGEALLLTAVSRLTLEPPASNVDSSRGWSVDNHLSISSTEVKNEWIYISKYSRVLSAWCEGKHIYFHSLDR
jgi:hypothetical protein